MSTNDVQLVFNPPAAWEELPEEVVARVDRLTEDLAALGPSWFVQITWGDIRTGTHELTASPATNQTGATT